jgi:hypothetical protein
LHAALRSNVDASAQLSGKWSRAVNGKSLKRRYLDTRPFR